VFVSGYTGKILTDHKVVDLDINLLQKSFTLKQLCGGVRAMSNQPQSPMMS
jgi:hypothetical protein